LPDKGGTTLIINLGYLAYGAHGADECVSVDQVVEASKVSALLIADGCGTEPGAKGWLHNLLPSFGKRRQQGRGDEPPYPPRSK
jgi:hypothetical protein